MRCPNCGSVKQLELEGDPATGQEIARCGACGWKPGLVIPEEERRGRPDMGEFTAAGEIPVLEPPRGPLAGADTYDLLAGQKPKLGPRADWPRVMMAIAAAAATRSRDETTRVGAVVCDSRWKVLGTGYNGGPAGSPESLPAGGPARHLCTVHAEENALLQAIMSAGPTGIGWAMLFSTHRPCARCIRLASHLGVSAIHFGLDQLSDLQADDADEIERILYFPLGSRIFGPRIGRDER